MKKLIFGTAVLIAALCCVSVPAGAQTGTVAFAGGRYDDGFVLSYGVKTNISAKLSLFNFVDWGKYGSINGELGYGGAIAPKWYMFALAGPNVTWQDPTGDPVVILVGSAGLVLAHDISTKFGGWLYGKYRFKFDNGTTFQNGSNFGAGGYYRF